MLANELIILSYHKFVEKESDYPYSRTYDQFKQDINKKVYDLITIDDGMECMIEACGILRRCNIRAKLFICTSLVGGKGYCTWGELKELSKYHDIENHAHVHKDHSLVVYERQYESILKAQGLITEHIGKMPRYFVAPYNTYNADTEMAAVNLNLVTLKERITIKNNSK